MQLTFCFSMVNIGRAARCIKNAQSVATPNNKPNSTPKHKLNINVIAPGNSSRLLQRHNGRTTSYSIINITAVIMTALNAAFGIYLKYGVKTPSASKIKMPAYL